MQSNPKKRSRHKVELEPISMDEILAAPGMSGFVSILDPPEKVPHLQALVNDIKDVPLDKLSDAALKARTIPETGRDAETTPYPEPLIAPEARKGPEIKTAPEAQGDTRSALPSYRVHAPMLNGRYVRRAVTAQEGHSAGEEILYQALWNCRYAHPESVETKILTIGWKAMSKLARLTPRNTKRNCQSLIAKLAIEQLAGENSRESIGRTYRVYSYKAIEERRQAAGLQWVTRSRGVLFVPAPPIWQPGLNEPGAETVPETKRDPGPYQIPTSVAQVFQEYLPGAEQRSVAELVRRCREKAPDATDDEIAYFLRQKAELMFRMGTVKSPMVFLSTAVPRCLEGDSLRLLREAELKRARSRKGTGE
jgi:hypothetical protein